MFDNIGGKIKGFAKIVAWLGIILSVIIGLLSMATGGILIMIIGGVSSWVGSFVLYGFGQLVENSDKLVANLPNSDSPAETAVPVAPVREPVKAWVCFSCGTENPGQRAYCMQCNTSRAWSEEKAKQE